MFDMTGRPEDADWPQRESTRRREAFFLDYAARLRKEITLPLAVTGGFRSLTTMRDALSRHALDVIGLARPLVTEPDLPRKMMKRTCSAAVRYEDRLHIGKGRFGPNSSLFLFKALNALGPLAWYYRQIIHLAENRPPDLKLGVWTALLRHQITEVRLARARRRRLQAG